jgi:hypothetical protein
MMLTRFINIIDFKKFKNLYLMKFFFKKSNEYLKSNDFNMVIQN